MIRRLRIWFYRRFHRLAIDRDEASRAYTIKVRRMMRNERGAWGWP